MKAQTIKISYTPGNGNPKKKNVIRVQIYYYYYFDISGGNLQSLKLHWLSKKQQIIFNFLL